MTLEKAIVFFTLFGVAVSSYASYITLDEAALDDIYSQPSFGDMPIDIRIEEAHEIVAPDLLDITTRDQVSQLFGMHTGSLLTVNFYYIDTISICGSTVSTSIVGCGEYFGNFADSFYGSELLAHELGHNLGLPHIFGQYLMNPSLNNNTTITEAEVARIRQSPLVQSFDGLYWINIKPVLIVKELVNVTEPKTWLLFFIMVIAVVSGHRRSKLVLN